MKLSALLIILIAITASVKAQNLTVTFSGTGASTQIDSVTATNLNTGRYVTLPGNETLVLDMSSGTSPEIELSDHYVVYPNPFTDQAIFSASIPSSQKISLVIGNLFGEIIANYQGFTDPGQQQFAIRLKTPGIYTISLAADHSTSSQKIICLNGGNQDNSLEFLGSSSEKHNHAVPSDPKTLKTGYILGFTRGDVILFRCCSGEYTTISTDSPLSTVNYEVEFAECTDDDGTNYPVVTIDDQTWMAENLAYLPKVDPSSAGSFNAACLYVNGYEDTDINSAKVNENYRIYGALYNWPAAVIACPSGWHLPSDLEWDKMTGYLGTGAGGKIKETGTVHWNSPNAEATNETGFTALPAGLRQNTGGFSTPGNLATFWSSTDTESKYASGRMLESWSDSASGTIREKSTGFSVRCVKNSGDNLPVANTYPATGITSFSAVAGGNVLSTGLNPITDRGCCWAIHSNPLVSDNAIHLGTGVGTFSCTLSGLTSNTTYFIRAFATSSAGTGYGHVVSFRTLEGGSFVDSRDSTTYNYVKIGNQFWMAENLAYLPAVSKPATNSGSVPHYYVYGYDSESITNARSQANYSTYGVLYNWPAALAACPDGWHLPGNAEFRVLVNLAGGDTIAGYKLKSVSGWNDNNGQNGNGDNTFGFTALPGGDMEPPGYFLNLGDYGSFWTADPDEGSNSLLWLLDNFNRGAFSHSYPRNIGFSVRCIRN